MTEDHRVVSTTERARMANSGQPLKDGESRICGICYIAILHQLQT